MLNNEQFVKYHWQQTITLVVITLVVVALNVVVGDTNWLQKDNGQVMGAAVVNLDASNENLDEDVLRYQNKIRSLVSDYLVKRSEFDKPHQDWLFLINKTKYQVLSTGVPIEYKNLHLGLITLLDLEKTAISQSDDLRIKQVNDRWAEFLEQYFG